ncbi:MAG TPA: nickel pincer cofactor biosynthesis protein LarC [Euzebyales bacterium]|nr:nickel pincer cofactor biosynthesis protein LarC [Euzebyales bacterium]
MTRVAWFDVSAGAAGDMLCGALVDAGVPLAVLQAAADAVIPGAVRWSGATVTRAGLRATCVSPTADGGAARRSWATIRTLLDSADLPAGVAERATAVFVRLAEAEARVHGCAVDDVVFHEVGGLDAIADVVGVCAALDHLEVTQVTAGALALGSGRASTRHGQVPVPVPAVLEMVGGWRVLAGGDGELTTPTGAALVTALAQRCTDLPALTVDATGVGAGSRDVPGRPNVVRVVLGDATAVHEPAGTTELVIETNVDDLDPRVWPGVLQRLLEAGARDAWLTPIVMKKGRPAHTLSVLAPVERAAALRRTVFAETSAIGMRETPVRKHALARRWVEVVLPAGVVRAKVALDGGRIVQATPEFDDVAALATRADRPVRDVLDAAVAAMAAQGLTPGAPAPAGDSTPPGDAPAGDARPPGAHQP